MQILNAIYLRKSVRTYAPKTVETEKMEVIIKAGNLAPVFGRFHMTVIENQQLLQEINDITLDMMKHSGNEFLEKRAATEGYNPLYGASALIVLSAPKGNDSNGFNMANVSCAAENMIIQATELGLGSCFVMGPMIAFANPELAKKVEILEGYTPLVGVLIGYPLEGLKGNKRNISNNVTYLK